MLGPRVCWHALLSAIVLHKMSVLEEEGHHSLICEYPYPHNGMMSMGVITHLRVGNSDFSIALSQIKLGL